MSFVNRHIFISSFLIYMSCIPFLDLLHVLGPPVWYWIGEARADILALIIFLEGKHWSLRLFSILAIRFSQMPLKHQGNTLQFLIFFIFIINRISKSAIYFSHIFSKIYFHIHKEISSLRTTIFTKFHVYSTPLKAALSSISDLLLGKMHNDVICDFWHQTVIAAVTWNFRTTYI